jgi:hypothetical protein
MVLASAKFLGWPFFNDGSNQQGLNLTNPCEQLNENGISKAWH